MKKKKIFSDNHMTILRNPIAISFNPILELEDSLRQGVIAFKNVLTKKITPKTALKLILSHSRCFSEIDYNLNIHRLSKIPSEVDGSLIYRDMSIAIHKVNQPQAHLASNNRKLVTGNIEISVEHAFMMLVYLAGSDVALGHARVDTLLKKLHIPLQNYGYIAVKNRITVDNHNKNIWIKNNNPWSNRKSSIYL